MSRYNVPRSKFYRLAVLIVVAASANSCDTLDPIGCTGEFVYGIGVSVFDSTDRAPVSEGMSGLLLEDNYVEILERSGNQLYGAGERAGTYAVIVTAPGYETWVRTGIEVTASECHVSKVRMEAMLVSVPPSA